MAMKAVANGFVLGHNNYFSDNWNRLDGTLVIISLIDGIITTFAGIHFVSLIQELSIILLRLK